MVRRTVAVVGGGCSGVLVTREILRRTDDDVVLIEPGVPGGGVAYGAARPWHLLNSRAGAMSADPDDATQFVRWAAAQGRPTGPDDFLPRREYGRYLRAVLDEAVADHPGRFAHHRDHVTRVRPDDTGCTLKLGGGGTVRADHVVLALGSPAGAHPTAVPPALYGHPGYVGDPWRPGALAGVPDDAPVLLIGTGLTAVDVALTLAASGRRAPLTAVSRRGRLPLAHTPASAPADVPPFLDAARSDCDSLRDLIRRVRAHAGQASDWRAVVDGLRPYLDDLWSALRPDQQDSFLRHLARHWECHRHRMAPSVAARIDDLRADGTLRIRAGGVRWVGAAGEPSARGAGDLLADLGDGVPRRFAAVVNCAGPGRLPESAGPLVGGLLNDGTARVGPHGLGLDIDGAGRVVGAAGTAHPRLWVVGALRRGARWETTAVPEIRAQAHRLVADLADFALRGPVAARWTVGATQSRLDAA